MLDNFQSTSSICSQDSTAACAVGGKWATSRSWVVIWWLPQLHHTSATWDQHLPVSFLVICTHVTLPLLSRWKQRWRHWWERRVSTRSRCSWPTRTCICFGTVSCTKCYTLAKTSGQSPESMLKTGSSWQRQGSREWWGKGPQGPSWELSGGIPDHPLPILQDFRQNKM